MGHQSAGLSLEDCLREIRRAGWVIGDSSYHEAGGRLTCAVTCIRGLRAAAAIVAYGATETEAWRAALEQVRALGPVGD